MYEELKKQEEILWINSDVQNCKKLELNGEIYDEQLILESLHFFKKQGQFLKLLFPELNSDSSFDYPLGSPLRPIASFQKALITFVGGLIPGQWLLKCDHELSISGSVKARGGIYALLRLTNEILSQHALPKTSEIMTSNQIEDMQAVLASYKIMVGSTGNLGLSIGTIGKRLGFQVEVHMSSDAKAWKKEALRQLGAEVIEHTGNYSESLNIARTIANQSEKTFFIDDENSKDLFIGYALAAYELKDQLIASQIPVDSDHPLFIYLPCGVGGAPSGIAFGLKLVFGQNVHIFTGEPTKAPCMLLSLASGMGAGISTEDIGIDGKTSADGLAVTRSSQLAYEALRHISSGAYTLSDEKMSRLLYLLHASEDIFLEPSACASLLGPVKLFYETSGFNYLKSLDLLEKSTRGTHISWGTGGSMVPKSHQLSLIDEGQNSSLITL